MFTTDTDPNLTRIQLDRGSLHINAYIETQEDATGLLALAFNAPNENRPAPATGTKADQLVAMLQRPQGASIAELVEAFGIQPHSATARISVETRRRGLKAKLADGRYTVTAAPKKT